MHRVWLVAFRHHALLFSYWSVQGHPQGTSERDSPSPVLWSVLRWGFGPLGIPAGSGP